VSEPTPEELRRWRNTATATATNRMTDAEIDTFLAGIQDARLGTLGDDGSIHMTPVWYTWVPEQRRVFFCIAGTRLHLQNMRRTGRATMLVDQDARLDGDMSAGAQAVMMSGTVEIVDDQDVVEQYRHRMGRRYLGDRAMRGPAAERYHLVWLRPEKILAWDYLKA
jgi:F420H(2)-dependent biliverdin reductase